MMDPVSVLTVATLQQPGVHVACLTAAVHVLHHHRQMMLIYAHRGASAIHPENTLRAFRHALAIGVDGIELDVHATADGIPVVIHDRDIGRTTNGAGYVDEMPLAQLETFDAGDGERVPTLAEV